MTPEQYLSQCTLNAKSLIEGLAPILDRLDNCIIKNHYITHGMLTLKINKEALIDVCHILKDTIGMEFKQLSDITACDWPEKKQRFEVVYHLLSMKENIRIRLLTTIDPEETLPSLCQIWPCANWYEREIWDMFGIVFSDHPDLRRILTDYGFEGHPLRKDFPLSGHFEVFYDATKERIVRKKIDIVQDYRDFIFASPWQTNVNDSNEANDENNITDHSTTPKNNSI